MSALTILSGSVVMASTRHTGSSDRWLSGLSGQCCRGRRGGNWCGGGDARGNCEVRRQGTARVSHGFPSNHGQCQRAPYHTSIHPLPYARHLPPRTVEASGSQNDGFGSRVDDFLPMGSRYVACSNGVARGSGRVEPIQSKDGHALGSFSIDQDLNMLLWRR